jgi:hypothetical protein
VPSIASAVAELAIGVEGAGLPGMWIDVRPWFPAADLSGQPS